MPEAPNPSPTQPTPASPTTSPEGLLAPSAADPKPVVDPAAVLFAAAAEAKPAEAPAKAVEPAKPEGEAAPKETLLGEQKADAEAKPAAIDYKFDFPADFAPDEAAIASAKTLLSSMNEGKGISQADADALVKFDIARQQARSAADITAWDNMRKEWREQVKLDPDIGGDKLTTEVLPRINKMLTAFTGSPAALKEFKQQLDASGMGDHPTVVRTLNKMALALTEGSAVVAGGPVGQRRSPAEVLFGSKPN